MASTSFESDFGISLRTGEAPGPVIEVHGELDSGTCEQLVASFRAALADHPGQSVTLDLSHLRFIDSAGTRSVIMIEHEAREQAVSLLVAAPPSEVTELLRTAGVIERFQVTPDARRGAVDSGTLLERIELDLPRDPRAAARARAEVRELMSGRDRAQVGDVVLLTSEVVTNAVIHPAAHADGPIGLRIFTYEEGIRVEVDDRGDGFDPSAPGQPKPERGRGLFLVDRFASRWGTEHTHDDRGRRFMVWFELGWREHRDTENV